jgi:hypothetical protein
MSSFAASENSLKNRKPMSQINKEHRAYKSDFLFQGQRDLCHYANKKFILISEIRQWFLITGMMISFEVTSILIG